MTDHDDALGGAADPGGPDHDDASRDASAHDAAGSGPPPSSLLDEPFLPPADGPWLPDQDAGAITLAGPDDPEPADPQAGLLPAADDAGAITLAGPDDPEPGDPGAGLPPAADGAGAITLAGPDDPGPDDPEPGLPPAGADDGAITLAGPDQATVAPALDDLAALDGPGEADDRTPGGDGPIDLGTDPGGLPDPGPPPGLLDEPPWDLVPDDNGAVGAAALGLALAAVVGGARTSPDRAGPARAADAPAAVAALERLGAEARLEHGGLHDLVAQVAQGGTVLLTGAGRDARRLPLALVGLDEDRGVLLFRPAEGPPSTAPAEVSVAAFQLAWDDTAAQMVVAGQDGGTIVLPVTVALP